MKLNRGTDEFDYYEIYFCGDRFADDADSASPTARMNDIRQDERDGTAVPFFLFLFAWDAVLFFVQDCTVWCRPFFIQGRENSIIHCRAVHLKKLSLLRKAYSIRKQKKQEESL